MDQTTSETSLTAEELFRLLMEEVYRDGVMEAEESDVFRRLATALKLDGLVAVGIAREARDRAARGEIEPGGTLDRSRLYERVVDRVLSDGVLDGTEEGLLDRFREVLRLSRQEHLRIMASRRTGGHGA